MNGDIKLYAVILFWFFILYFIGVKRYSLLFQNVMNGKIIRKFINIISLNSFKSTLSGIGVAGLMQSPFGAINHIRGYAQSGLVTFRQMCLFISGAFLVNIFSPIYFLTIVSVPKKIIIATIFFCLFTKLLFSRLRYWIIDALLISSVVLMSYNELLVLLKYLPDELSPLLTSINIFIFSMAISFLFKSFIFSTFIFILLITGLTVPEFYLHYLIGSYCGFGTYLLFSSVRSHRTARRSMVISSVSVVSTSLIFIYMNESLHSYFEMFLGKSVSVVEVFMKNSLFEPIFYNIKSWVASYSNFSIADVSYYLFLNLQFVVVFTTLLFLLTFIFDNLIFKRQKQPKEMQNLKFPANTQFYSPYIYVDHFKHEAKKMAAMLQHIINITLDETSHSDAENLLRAKKYNLILERVKVETRNYSVNSLKRINIPFSNQENLYLLQITEVIEELSQKCLELLNKKTKIKFDDLEVKIAEQVLKNYEHIFESFTEESISIYPTNIDKLINRTELSELLEGIHSKVLELATILKNINRLKIKFHC